MLFTIKAKPGPSTIANHGRPARCVPFRSMPAYESQSGALAVMENLLVHQSSQGQVTLIPVSYLTVALRAPSDLVALHDNVDAVWSWRPLIYAVTLGGLQQQGSQGELGWRYGLHMTVLDRSEHQDDLAATMLKLVRKAKAEVDGYDDLPEAERFAIVEKMVPADFPLEPSYDRLHEMDAAKERARAILLENLDSWQRLEYLARGEFYVGGQINRLYLIEPGNGCSIVDPATREKIATVCLHPEGWIPHEDVALATKLLIDSGNEEELLEAGIVRYQGPSHRPSRDERRARRLEVLYRGLPRSRAIIVHRRDDEVFTSRKREVREAANLVGDSLVPHDEDERGGRVVPQGKVLIPVGASLF